MPTKIRQLPSETRTIRREILRGKARGPRGTLFAQVYNENRRRTAVDDADEPQLGDVREFAVGEVAVVPCVVGYTSRDGDGELLSPVGLGSFLAQSPALSVRSLAHQGEVSSGRVGVVQVENIVFVGVCGVCELENDGPQLERELEESAVFLTMSIFDKTCNAGERHV